MWKRLCDDSAMDKGTLQQLKHLINRTNLPQKPKNNMNAADDFVKVVVIGHVSALALKHFHMLSLTDKPNHRDLWKIHHGCRPAEKQKHFHHTLMIMRQPHVHLFTIECFGSKRSAVADREQLYEQEVLTLGLIYSEFKDRVIGGVCFSAGSSFCQSLKQLEIIIMPLKL